MDTFTAINERMVTMEFKDYSLPRVIIENIIDMAMKAPSAKNRQPWKFAIIRADKVTEFKNFIKEKDLDFDIDCNIMEDAAAIILIFNRYKKIDRDYNEITEEMDLISIGSALQNLVLAAEGFNLGSMVIGDFAKYEREIGKYLDIENSLVTGIIIGFAGENCIKKENGNIEDMTIWFE
ncbi:MAG: nitroreductase family protein [Andreesenia angusta]|nr:nitroreductase family protein [Andreesenia angusta]